MPAPFELRELEIDDCFECARASRIELAQLRDLQGQGVRRRNRPLRK